MEQVWNMFVKRMQRTYKILEYKTKLNNLLLEGCHSLSTGLQLGQLGLTERYGAVAFDVGPTFGHVLVRAHGLNQCGDIY